MVFFEILQQWYFSNLLCLIPMSHSHHRLQLFLCRILELRTLSRKICESVQCFLSRVRRHFVTCQILSIEAWTLRLSPAEIWIPTPSLFCFRNRFNCEMGGNVNGVFKSISRDIQAALEISAQYSGFIIRECFMLQLI